MEDNKNFDLNIIVIPLVDTNCYVLTHNNKALLVDAGGAGDEIINFIKNHNLVLESILLTHGHYDHIEALDNIVDEFPKVYIYANINEKRVIEDMKLNLMGYNLKEETLKKINYIDEINLNILDLNIKVLFTPGHTIGSTSYYISDLDILFSGDTLFLDSYGRCDLPTGDMKEIVKSVALKIMMLPDKTTVYPGHGDKTTISYERKHSELMKDYVIDWALKK
ncbi:MAG: MBL fold metallo-hydrolase [Lachnospiraceae bacterium]|nr:MBL fold metallo-hydrolase [Lachnospiraceae bacterium]